MKIKKSVVIQKLGDTFVAYDNETSTLHEFNETGFLILSEIERGKGKKTIVKKIVNNFRASKIQAERDFEEFLEVLKKKDLIVDKK
jgi:hypothetical protein